MGSYAKNCFRSRWLRGEFEAKQKPKQKDKKLDDFETDKDDKNTMSDFQV